MYDTVPRYTKVEERLMSIQSTKSETDQLGARYVAISNAATRILRQYLFLGYES